MKNHNFRHIQINIMIALTAIAVLFSSAGNILNIKERIFVHALGIDPCENGELMVTMQVFKPQGAGSDTPVDVMQSNIQVVESKGKTVGEAVSKAQNSLGREIFLGHLQVICLNKSMDLSHPENLFEFCLKDKNVFLGVKICIGENTAEEIMNTQITRGTTTSESFVNTIEKSGENSTGVDCELIDFLSQVNNADSYVAVPVISVKESSQEQSEDKKSQEGGQSGENSEQEIEIKETALVRNGKVLEEYLDTDLTQGLVFLTDKGKYGEFPIEIDSRQTDIKLTPEKLKRKIKINSGKIIVYIDFTANARNSSEVTQEKDKEEIVDKVKSRTEKIFTQTVETAFYRNKTDVFGVEKLLRHSYPQVYLKYKDSLDIIFDNAEFVFDVNIKA